MRNIPNRLIKPFRNWLVSLGYQGMRRGDHLTAWKPKHKQIEINGVRMNKPCQEVFQVFLKQYLKNGKSFLEELSNG